MRTLRILSLALAASALIMSCSNPAASAETSTSKVEDRAPVGPPPLTYYVANSGNNNNAGTSAAAPLKSITFALTKAAAANPQAGNTVYVKLAPGTYNAQNAEAFPLIMPPYVVLTGDIANRGNGTVPTKIVGEGTIPGGSSAKATIIAQEYDSISGLWITTGNASTSGIHTAVYFNQGLGIQVSWCSIVRSETGIYGEDNVQANIHDNVIEKNVTGVRLNQLTPTGGAISTLSRNSIRFNNSRGVYLTLKTGGVLPDMGGAQIGVNNNGGILPPTPIYGKGLNTLAWNTVQDLYIDEYGSGVSGSFFLYARNNAWSQVAPAGSAGGVILWLYNFLAVDSSNASLGSSTPSIF